MKKLLVIVSIFIYSIQHSFAQNLQNRIKSVENGLIPLVPVKGFKSWNIEERMKDYKILGVSIAVINNFEVEWAKAYGWADTLRKIPMSTETMLSAGSISKMVMAAGAMKLTESGKLDLDKPINNYLQSWKLDDNKFTKDTPVTLRMLLSHTAGTSQSAYFGYEADAPKIPTIVEILDGKSPDGTRKVGVNKQPNTGFQYSGGGSLVAQLAMMDVSKQAFEPMMRELVFDKLGMSNATFEQPLSSKYAAKASWGYQDAIWYKGTPYIYPQQAAAGLYSTPSDLAKFIIDLQKSYHGKGKILSQLSLKEMMKPQAIFSEGNVSKEEIAVGPFLYQKPDNKDEKGIYFYFSGANAGFIAEAMGNLTEGYGVVIMVNSGNDYNGLCKEIRRAVAKEYSWYNFLPQELKPITLKAKVLDEYVGRFKKNDNEVVYVSREKDYLKIKYNDGADIYTFFTAKDSVVFTDYNIKGWFTRNEKGEVIGIQNQYQKEFMPRMTPDEFSITELLKQKRFEEAKAKLRTSKANEYELTYMAYEYSRNLDVSQAILEVASERFPESDIVFTSWAKLYQRKGDKPKAIEYIKKALKKDPFNKDLKEELKKLEEN
jgi:CubicO group peptidase (beta-lactamase class C family)